MDKKRLYVLISIALIVPLGFASKLYKGPAQLWFNNSLGGVLYVIFWCLAARLFLPGAQSISIAAGVFVITSLLETLQLWHPPFLQAIRGTFLGATVLGATFVWTDFFYYIAGALFGWLWIKHLQP